MARRAILLAVLLAACGGSASGGSGGSVEGWAFLDGGGSVVLGRTAAPPPGATPLAGAAVEVVDTAAAGTTGADGRLRLDGVPAGLRTLRLTPPGGAPVDTALTVVAGATITVGTPAVDRGTAVALALADLGLPVDPAGVTVLAPQQPLPAGVTVAPSLGDDEGLPDPALEHVTGGDTWLVYVDLFPGARFQHRVEYHLVDAGTGAVTRMEATSWPALNGFMYYGDAEANATSPDLAQAATTGLAAAPVRAAPAPVPPAAPAALAAHDPACRNAKSLALVVLGDNRDDFVTDFSNMVTFTEQCLMARTFVYAPRRDRKQNAALEIRRSFEELCRMAGPCDTIVVSFHTHGLPNGQLKINEINTTDGQTATSCSVNYRPFNQLPWESCGAGHIVMHFDVCHAGQAIMEMQRRIEGQPGIFRGKKVTLVGSSAADEVSFGGDSSERQGGFFTNAMLDALRARGYSTALDPDEVAAAFMDAGPATTAATGEKLTAQNPDGTQRTRQHPVLYERPLAPGEKLRSDGVATRWVLCSVVPLGPHPAGSAVPLGELEGWRYSPAELPVTEERGCATPHLHAATPAGITVKVADGGTVGPIPDPAPSHCGYGEVKDAPFGP